MTSTLRSSLAALLILCPAGIFTTGRADDAPNVRILEGHQGSVMCVTFSPDQKTLATSSRDTMIHLWNVATGKLERKISGHTEDVYCVAYSPKGDLLASGSGDKSIRMWNTKTWETVRT